MTDMLLKISKVLKYDACHVGRKHQEEICFLHVGYLPYKSSQRVAEQTVEYFAHEYFAHEYFAHLNSSICSNIKKEF